MPEINFRDLNEFAVQICQDFFRGRQDTNIYRILSLSFVIVTSFCRIHHGEIKTEQRCEIALRYIPTLLEFLADKGILHRDNAEKLLQIYDSGDGYLEIIEAMTFVVKSLTWRETMKKDSCCGCVLL